MTALLSTVDFSALCQEGVRGVALVCALRGLPFLVHAWLRPGARITSRLAWLLPYVGVVAIAFTVRPDLAPLWCLLGSLFYLGCGCLVPTCARLLRERRVSAGALFALFAFSFLLLPGLLAPEVASATFLVLGWDLLLSAYSYCHDVAHRNEDPPLRECLFFLFVDPTVSYSKRSRPFRELETAARERRPWGARRALLGVATMFAAHALLHPTYRVLGDVKGLAPGAGPGLALAALIAFGVARFFAEYAALSGLASIQIGLMRRAGYATPERYRMPFLAKDPIDFWRRWNTYVAGWLRQYVFVPTARRLRARALPGATPALAVMVTVVASGLLHDGYAFAADQVARTHALEFFLAQGLAILAWAAASRVRRALPALREWNGPARLASRVLFTGAMLGACVWWG